MSEQDYTAWFTDYPPTHRLAGQSVEVVPRAEYERLRRFHDAVRPFLLAPSTEKTQQGAWARRVLAGS